jgi:Glycosyl transferase family 2
VENAVNAGPNNTGNPVVSVVIAAYNRSNVLRYAIQSVIDSTFADWELIVVGDHCTDDTADCVAAFDDSRIRFVNLPINSGDQSGPNNAGVTLARGRYVAFLNQDDLYLPHHLASCVAALDTSDADIVLAPCIIAHPQTDPDQMAFGRFSICCVAGPRGYDPFEFYSASSWMFRRSLMDKLGPWPRPNSVVVTTSQAWLFRAWRTGAILRGMPRVGVMLIFSGERKSSYAMRNDDEHNALAQRLRDDPQFRAEIFDEAAVLGRAERMYARKHQPLRNLAITLAYPAYILLMALAIHPNSLQFFIRYGGTGGFLRAHRRYTKSHASR